MTPEQADAKCSEDVVAEALEFPPGPMSQRDMLLFGHNVWHRAYAHGVKTGKEVTLAAAREGAEA